MVSARTILRTLPVVGSVAGAVHLLVPGKLLAVAEWGYDRVLAVDFEPRDRATRRVRLVGVPFLAVSALLARVGTWD